jgi:hypothetical protein
VGASRMPKPHFIPDDASLSSLCQEPDCKPTVKKVQIIFLIYHNLEAITFKNDYLWEEKNGLFIALFKMLFLRFVCERDSVSTHCDLAGMK